MSTVDKVLAKTSLNIDQKLYEQIPVLDNMAIIDKLDPDSYKECRKRCKLDWVGLLYYTKLLAGTTTYMTKNAAGFETWAGAVAISGYRFSASSS